MTIRISHRLRIALNVGVAGEPPGIISVGGKSGIRADKLTERGIIVTRDIVIEASHPVSNLASEAAITRHHSIGVASCSIRSVELAGCLCSSRTQRDQRASQAVSAQVGKHAVD